MDDLSADYADFRRFFYPQITQIYADYDAVEK